MRTQTAAMFIVETNPLVFRACILFRRASVVRRAYSFVTRAVIGASRSRARSRPRVERFPPSGFIGRDSRSDNDSVRRRGAWRRATNNGNGMTNGMTNRTASTKARAEKRTSARQARGSRTTIRPRQRDGGGLTAGTGSKG